MTRILSSCILRLTVIMATFAVQTAPAEQINLAQYPAGTAYKMPIPNVILSVDDSGSMTDKDGTKKSRMQWLKDGLQNTLINQSKYDGQFRLAWQSFKCDDIPSNRGGCSRQNAIAKFTGTHKANFEAWIHQLTADQWTPSHKLVWNAGQYLMLTGKNSPWNANPGTVDNNPLACRKSYHVFLTDGGWNRYTQEILPNFDSFGFQAKMQSNSPHRIEDADQTSVTLPDDEHYDVDSDQTRVYQGAGGDSTVTKCTRTDRWGRCTRNVDYSYPTLSDMAFYFWSRDLQPDIANEVIPSITKSGPETFSAGTKSTTLEEYWNPKNNPATWQHLIHYTIGYGDTASKWTNSGTNPQFDGGMFGSGLTKTIVGLTHWSDVTSSWHESGRYDLYRPEDLWHMAINSRGKYYPVSGGDLEPVFDEIFGNIVSDNTKPITGFTSASGLVSRVGTSSFQSGYTASEGTGLNENRWYGYVISHNISTNGTSTPNPDWGTIGGGENATPKTTADKLNALTDLQVINNRMILTFNDDLLIGVPFEWNNGGALLSEAQQALTGKDLVNYIRGDRSLESNGGGGTFRVRKSRQGDIVNSAIWYTGAPANQYAFGGYHLYADSQRDRAPMLYVGGNDGMLHGFAAADGTEKIAYIPQGLMENLALLADINYQHRYYVDGSPFTGDVKLGSGNTAEDWNTYLVGTLGAGGKGYFVLDVSDPDHFTKDNAASIVVMDRTAYNSDLAEVAWEDSWKDIGYIFGDPVVAEDNSQRSLQITRTNDGRWAAIMGNGYNSENERPVLLVQYLDQSQELKRIPAVSIDHAEAVSNGLSTPQFLDVNGDSIPDFVYAGDLRGNLWKFDISSSNASSWDVVGDAPLFTATYSTAAGATSRQPITTPPVFRPNREVGGLMVAFGTGRNITEGDRTDVSFQTIYSILDNTRYDVEMTDNPDEGKYKGKVKIRSNDPVPSFGLTRDDLEQQFVDGASKFEGQGRSSERSFWKLQDGGTAVRYKCGVEEEDCSAKKGWYLDLPEEGERVLTQMDFYDGGNILEIITEVPASGSATADGEEVCTPSPRAVKNYRMLLNITTGIPSAAPLLNVDGNTIAQDDSNTLITGLYDDTDVGYFRMTASSKELRIATKFEQVRIGGDGKEDYLSKLPEVLLRPNWRQLK